MGRPRLRVGRDAIDELDLRALRGLIAHELAHLRDPHARRRRGAQLASGALVVAGTPAVLALAALTAQDLLAPLALVPAALGGLLMSLVCRTGEYAADVRAATLVGSETVMHWLRQTPERGVWSHPSTARRIARLSRLS